MIYIELHGRIFSGVLQQCMLKLSSLVKMKDNAIRCPIGGLVGGCGARAVSRKTPFYFIQ